LAAALALAPPGHGFEQSCLQCHNPDLRRQWGCDEPTSEPLTFIAPCPFCSGENEHCPECHGNQNGIPVHRCPNSQVTQREFDMINAAVLAERGTLPDPGGWQDQAATFVRAYPLAVREIAHWTDVHRKVAMAKARQK
jgi:hypothetical protein